MDNGGATRLPMKGGCVRPGGGREEKGKVVCRKDERESTKPTPRQPKSLRTKKSNNEQVSAKPKVKDEQSIHARLFLVLRLCCYALSSCSRKDG